jgi:chitodextrinase
MTRIQFDNSITINGRMILFLGSVLVGMSVVGCYKKEAPKPSEEVMVSGEGASYMAHEIIVQKSAEVSMADFESEIEAAGGAILDRDSLLSTELGYYRVALSDQSLADEAISGLQVSDAAASAERNYVVTLDRTPNDPKFSQTWGMTKIAADKAWDETQGSKSVLVAVSDTGIDRNHLDLKANLWTNPDEIPGNGIDDDKNGYVDDVNGWDFANSDADPMDDHGHGTHCSGTIGAVGDDGVGVAGVNWKVSIMAVKFLGANGSGSLWNGAQSVLYAALKGAKVVNASWGCQGCYTDYLQNAIATLESKGGLFVAAAGNSTMDIDATPFYPAGYPNTNLVAVAALDSSDNLASFSNWGKTKVHLGAPGVGIMSSLPNNSYSAWSGTSMAAPHVTGAAALYLSKYPNTTPEELKNRLTATVDKLASISGKTISGGRLNVYRMFKDDAAPPSAPTALSVRAGEQNDAILTWTPVADPDVSVYRARFGTASGQYIGQQDVSFENTEMTVSDLTANVTYYFAVFAVDKAGNVSAPSNEVSVRTGDTLAPPQVLDLTASPEAGGVVTGEVVAASSEASDYYRAENAADNSAETAWIALPSETDDEQYIIIELGESQVVERVTLTPVAAYPEFFPQDFDVEMSQDGSEWVVVGGMRGASVTDETPIDINFPALQASEMRLSVHKSYQHKSGLYYAGLAEIAVYAVTDDPDMIRLMFTAPGDDPGKGRATSYDIRYSTSVITADNFSKATAAPSSMPSEAGLLEDVRVNDLLPETPYWFAMKATDDAGNVSPMSNVALTATVIVPPGAVQDLSMFTVDNNSVTLTWTAPGKDAYEGRATAYDLRYSLLPITSANFDAQTKFQNVPAPKEAGVREYLTVTGLQHKNYYYFAVKAIDEKGNIGGMSNVASARTEFQGKDTIKPARIEDLDVYESLSQVPIVAVVTGSSSAVQDSYSAAKIVDGSLDTMWISKEDQVSAPEWVTFDLAETTPISSLRIHPSTFGARIAEFPQDFSLQASADNVHWTSVLDITSQKPTVSGRLEWRFDVVTARYLRLYVSKRGVASCTTSSTSENSDDRDAGDMDAGNADNEGTVCTLPSRITIAEVEIQGPTEDFDVDLVWVAPGDDEWDGIASVYDLRHSTTAITEDNFSLAAPIPIAPPLDGGSLEARMVRDLEWGIAHYFAIKTEDNEGNWSEMSNVATIGAPSIPPSPIDDLAAVNPTRTSLDLEWTAVGDDNLIGRATYYDVRYSLLPITPDNFRNATVIVNPPAPADPGTAQSMSVTGLMSGTMYFFALKVVDDEGASSILSNIAYNTTLDAVPPYQIEDLDAFPVEPKDDPPLAATIGESSGSYTPSSGADKLLDGKTNTSWLSPKRSQVTEEYVRFDLPTSVRLGTIRLLPAPTYEDMFPVDFKVEVRNADSDAWTTVISETGFASEEGKPEEWSIGSVWAKQARLVITRTAASNGGYFTALSEFELIEDPTRYDAILVSWTAPSDPEEENVTDYDLRQDRKPIKSEPNFAAATPIETGEPKSAGMPERMEVQGLDNETEYCFAIKSKDSLENLSGLSNSACAVTRGMPPATTVDLKLVSVTAHTATVSWTAPGDDGTLGQANRYDIRVFEKRINRETWAVSKVIAHPPLPKASGSSETYTIDGLEGDTAYYIALRTYDEANNESGISNNVRTLSADDVPPSEVMDLSAKTNTSEWGSLIVNWTAPGDSGSNGQSASYDLRVSTSPITASNFSSAAKVSAPVPSPRGAAEQATVTGLNPEALYYAALKSKDSEGNLSAMSNVASARTRDEAPSAIADLAASASSGAEQNNATVSLKFTAPGDDANQGRATRYDVRYSSSAITADNFQSAVPFTTTVTPSTSGTAQEIPVSGLAVGSTYYFAIKTIDDRGNISAISNVPSTKTKDQVPPSPVLDLVAQTGTARGSVKLSWTHTGDDGTTGKSASYELRWSTNPITASNFEQATKTGAQPSGGTGGASGSITATALLDETLLHFAMKAKDDEGNVSLISNDASARTPDVAPSRIADLKQTGATFGSVTISWTAVGDDEKVGTASAYDLRISSIPLTESNFDQAEPVFISAPKSSGSLESAVIDKLSPSTTYYVAIKAVDERDNRSPISNVLGSATGDNTPPGTIDDLSASTGTKAGEIKLAWTATGDDDDKGTATDYDVRYGFECITTLNWDTATPAAITQKPRVSGSAESFTVTGLQGEKHYFFAIRAIDDAGNIGALSEQCVGADTPAVPPAAILDLVGLPTKPRSVVLSWTAPGADGNDGKAAEYDIRYAKYSITASNFSQTMKFENAPVPEQAGTKQTATVTELEESTMYYFAIKAVDSLGGTGPISNVVKVTTFDETPPGSPYAVVATTSIGTGGIVFTPKAVTASSQLADTLGPKNVLDDDDDSMWVSDGVSKAGPEWIQLELSAAGRVDRIRLLPNPDYLHLFPENFKVETSLDNQTWKQVLLMEDFEAPSDSWMTFGFEPASAKFIRLTSYDPIISYFGLYYTVIAGMDAISAEETTGGTSLAWRAPGDDDMTGTAKTFEVYYRSIPFDESTLETAIKASGAPAPKVATSLQSMSIGGLRGEQAYYFAIRVADEAGNIGPLSEVVTATSTNAPPSPVKDLSVVETTMQSATLHFNAGGDDGLTGRAARYEMRFATWSLVMENFPFADEVVGMPDPEEPGTLQEVTISDLMPGTTYHFAMKVYDETGNGSYLSNVATAKTAAAPDFEAPLAVYDLFAETVTDGNSTVQGTVIERTSEQPPEFVADAIIDGDRNTFWASAASPASSKERLEIELASVTPVKEMKMWPAVGFESLFPKGVDIEVSADRLVWRKVFSNSDYSAVPETPLTAAFPVVPVKYVRLNVNETAMGDNDFFYAVVAELEVIHAEAVPGTVTVSWTATGDDGASGTADAYDLRVGACPLDFDTATPVVTDAPKVSGTPEIARIRTLTEGTFCIGLIVTDEANNPSELSNIVEVYTPGV